MSDTSSIQSALFEHITRQFRNRAAAIADYQQRFPGNSGSTARARFSGTTAITYDHGMQVASTYDLHDLDIWPDGWPKTHLVVRVPSLQPDMDAYLDMFLRDLQHLKQQPRARLHLAIGNVPLLLLKKYRHLAGFYLYFTLSISGNHPYFRRFMFGPNFLNDSHIKSWLDRAREALIVYQQIPGVEYWSPLMFDRLLHNIKLVKSNGYFEETGLIDSIMYELHRLVDEMEQMTNARRKIIGPGQHQAPVQIFNHGGFIVDTLLVAESETSQFSYEEHDLLHLYRHDTNISEQQLKKIDSVGRSGGELGTALDSRFFTTLRSHLKFFE